MQGRNARLGNQVSGIKQLHFRGSGLDTLELTSELVPDSLDLSGNGDASKSNLIRRNAAKVFSGLLMMKLIELKSANETKYRDTYYCSQVITVEGDKAKTKFCRKRWCIICNRIRTADLCNRYLPTLESWPDKQFVTLTIPNVPVKELKPTLERLYKTFVLIKDNLRKQDKFKLVGLRKLEITYNRFTDTYHPHFHIITQKDCSDRLLELWYYHWPDATSRAQDCRPADQASCFELLKYFTKLTSNSSRDNTITAEALDNIFQSVEKVRTFQTFGFVPHVEVEPIDYEEELRKAQLETLQDIEEYYWSKNSKTWVSKEGEILVNYTPNKKDEKEKVKIYTHIKRPQNG